jgi:glycogen phosphorylase
MSKRSDIYGRSDIKGYEDLEELALNLMWSWNRHSDNLWQTLDPTLWEYTRNPWVILQTVSKERLEKMCSDASFQKMVKEHLDIQKNEKEAKGWFQKNHAKAPIKSIAYFSMEYMLSEALPIYSGGLGNVAGDQLKAASDLGVPVVGIGLLYQQGYFRQVIDKDGNQQALYPYNSPSQLPIMPLRTANGEWLRIEIPFPGWPVWLRAWEARVGKVKLYLLDSNDAANFPPHRGITSELYGGDSELRLKQELILGIGGWRVLEALGIKPEVCHLNEGHAAFAVLDRAKSYMKEKGVSFEVALAATRPGNLFTTHTAVPAGFDRFSPYLIEQYLSKYAAKLGISTHDLLALGRQNPNDNGEPFNMAYLAMRGSGKVNGVSKLHGKVSRHIFLPLFPRWPEEEVPVEHITNGIHTPSWGSSHAEELWSNFCGKERWKGTTETLEMELRKVPDKTLWDMRNTSRSCLVEDTRTRLARIWEARGFPQEMLELAKTIFDPNTLTLGFARRFATYKRTNILLHDKERLIRILTNKERPVQLVLAGKAHPADKPGQALIREWVDFIRSRTEIRSHIAFISDYDMMLTKKLVEGVDVWINTPRRPWEACGTSGMKVLVNGGLNLSELDGWWVEAYTPEVGWALGDGNEHGEDPNWDAKEAHALYDLLEQKVVPEFYNRNKEGLPTEWLKRIRESMAKLTPQFCANRAVREYTEKCYIPAAENYQRRSADDAAEAKEMLKWKESLNSKWDSLKFGSMKVETKNGNHHFEIEVYLNHLDPKSVKVQLFGNADGKGLFILDMECSKKAEMSCYTYKAKVPSDKPASFYTARIIPNLARTAVPLEEKRILWQK